MNTTHRTQTAFTCATAMALLALTANPARAATMSASATAPAVTGADIANLGFPVTLTDKWWNDNKASGATRGQTFTTGGTPVLLKAITYQTSSVAMATKTYVIRVGTFSGSTFTQIASETATQNFTWNAGAYMTWTLATPVLLAASTSYAIDVAMASSTTDWPTGIPYLNTTGNNYAGGAYFTSGTLGVGNSTIAINAAYDRTFHLDMQHPMAPSPEDGATVPVGDVALGWTNMTPTTGTDVWVDVWFGTNPAALTKIVTASLNTTTITVNAPGAATYYWRVDSYLNGAPTGTPVTGTVFTFVVFDSDGDGFPDSYELAHTTPASATALNRDDDLEPDGLTNWQEYQLGTDPNKADTDNDTLNDGPELAGVGSRPATDPLKADTDGDGLGDGVESNTGTWGNPTNTGTNPTKADTDTDGLKDGVETHTGTYVSATNTGTSPLLADSDTDGVGDWYEVTATYTNPNSSSSKPNIPYPLPDPDPLDTGVSNKPVKVYIMSGQSNMVGIGYINGGAGSLTTIAKTENKFPNLVNSTGAWTTRNDVRYRGVVTAIGNGQLTPGVGGANNTQLGPELGFGHVMGWYHDEPVLLLKASQGNRALNWDFLPPGSTRYDYNGYTYAGHGDAPDRWLIGGGPSPFAWYAGLEFDECFRKESDFTGPNHGWTDATSYAVNVYIRHNGVTYSCKAAHTSSAASEPGIGASSSTYWNVFTSFNAADVLDEYVTAGTDFEIAGYVWWQGNRDIGSGSPSIDRYETNMVQFIKQLRAYYANRYPDKCSTTTPFVLATGCGDPQTSGNGLVVANAQLAASDPARHPEFAGNVKTMDIRGYWRSLAESPGTQGFHYNNNAETYMLTGDALGRGMIDLLESATPTGFASWQATNGTTGQTLNLDHDGDGVPNGIEYFLGGPTGNTTGFTALPGVSNSSGALSVTWTKAAGYTGSYGADFVVETSVALTGVWTAESLAPSGNVTITGNDVKYTFPSPLGSKNFVRLKVTGP
jgi:hypothetical protein